MANFWMVRAGSGGGLSQEFLNKKCVAIGFGADRDLSSLKNKEQIREMLRADHPDVSAAKIGSWLGAFIDSKKRSTKAIL